MIRVVLPQPLRHLARLSEAEIQFDLAEPATASALVDAVEQRYPMLRGTLRDPATRRLRPFVRMFACEQDITHAPPDMPLPSAVVRGEAPLILLGAIAGG